MGRFKGFNFQARRSCFCAFCKVQRRVYASKHVGILNVLSSFLLASGVSIVIFGKLEPKALVLFCLFLMLSEFFVFVRWRRSVVCHMCGFDPIIYKSSPARASLRVQQFFKEKQQDPQFMLSRSPLLGLQQKLIRQERLKAEFSERQKRLDAKRPQRTPLAPGRSV